jgi:hypothetical protein
MGKIPIATWLSQNQGSTQDRQHPQYLLALQYINEKKFCFDSEFNYALDCYDLDNFCHAELRGEHRFFRPSHCTKFVLRRSSTVFDNSSYLYSYHGTRSSNVASILQYGLLPGGTKIEGKTIPQSWGAALESGAYSRPRPLYAQLYAPSEKWRGYFVQTIFLLRQPATALKQSYADGHAALSMLGRSDLWRLHGGVLGPDGNGIQGHRDPRASCQDTQPTSLAGRR